MLSRRSTAAQDSANKATQVPQNIADAPIAIPVEPAISTRRSQSAHEQDSVLTIQDVATLDGVLGDFLRKAEAELTVVIDKRRQCWMSQFGDHNVMDVTIIAALAAGSFAATCELARRIGEGVEFNALYHGANGQPATFANSVDEDTIMITVFSSRTTVGLVRLFHRRRGQRGQSS